MTKRDHTEDRPTPSGGREASGRSPRLAELRAGHRRPPRHAAERERSARAPRQVQGSATLGSATTPPPPPPSPRRRPRRSASPARRTRASGRSRPTGRPPRWGCSPPQATHPARSCAARGCSPNYVATMRFVRATHQMWPFATLRHGCVRGVAQGDLCTMSILGIVHGRTEGRSAGTSLGSGGTRTVLSPAPLCVADPTAEVSTRCGESGRVVQHPLCGQSRSGENAIPFNS